MQQTSLLKRLKYGLVPILIVGTFFALAPLGTFAANTHSFDFTNSASYGSHADAASLDLAGNVTQMLRVKFQALNRGAGSNISILMGKGGFAGGDGDGAYYIVWYPLESGGTDYFQTNYRRTADNNALTYNYTPTLGAWIQLGASRNATTGETIFCLAGSEVASVANSAGSDLVNNASAFTIGGDGSANRYSDALIDDVRLYNTFMECADQATAQATEASCSASGLVGYWKGNNDLVDCTTNANNLTNNGSFGFSTDVAFGAEGAVATEPDDLTRAADVIGVID